jgi:hypothetical protein
MRALSSGVRTSVSFWGISKLITRLRFSVQAAARASPRDALSLAGQPGPRPRHPLRPRSVRRASDSVQTAFLKRYPFVRFIDRTWRVLFLNIVHEIGLGVFPIRLPLKVAFRFARQSVSSESCTLGRYPCARHLTMGSGVSTSTAPSLDKFSVASYLANDHRKRKPFHTSTTVL